MSTYPTTVRARASSRVDHSLAVWAALGAALIGAVLILILAVPDREYVAPHSRVIGPHIQTINPDSRFDGGPNEGTRGAANRSPVDSAVTRFDGGPAEGSRGTVVSSNPVQAPTFDRGPRAGHVGDVVSPTQLPSPAVSSTRFDGGPNEGTRGAAVQYSASTRFDGGPDEGTRGAAVQYSASTRFDGGPNEGTRGH
jgi:hypothetical protein